MRVVFTSDTHGKHAQLGTLHGDVLIHCGDFCNGLDNDGHSIAELDEWFARQDFAVILCVGGNHDFLAATQHAAGRSVFRHASYLVDSRYEYRGVVFYGAPWLPDLDGWANYLPDGPRKKKWALVPPDTDVLITHTPPRGILDQPRSQRHVGCRSLRSVVDRIQPRIHCFGHVHASPGATTVGATEFINATAVDSWIEINNTPIVREISPGG